MDKRIALIAVGIIVMVILAYALTHVAKKPEQTVSSTPDNSAVTKPSDPAGRTLVIPVTVTKQFFNPKTISVRPGDIITLQITAADMDHSVYFPQYNIGTPIKFQQTAPLAFNATQNGTFLLLCNDRCNANVNLTIIVQ